MKSDVVPIARAMEVLAELSQNEIERQRYEARRQTFLDLAAMAEERDTAFARGKLVNQVQFCQRLLGQRRSSDGALEDLSMDQLQRLADDLEKQAMPPKP